MARSADPALRERIVQAAREVFRKKGFVAARMSDIAEEAGVAVGSIYLHFKTKESLCNALADILNRRVLEESIPLMAHRDPAEGIDLAIRAALRICAEESDLLSILYLNIGFGPWENYLNAPSKTDQQVIDAFAGYLQQRMETGEFRRYDVIKLVHMISNLIERTAVDCVLMGAGPLEAYEDSLVLFLQGALLTHPPAPKPMKAAAAKAKRHAKA